ncbi:MAG: 50S ribosomal protein L15 [Aestuariivita sp.]|nr:50S ribosomal protein L15 [Aestuariivita sp.]MCY4347209.1 50S ribosomal protein L15 [Aestuariivita sp.]
MKLNQLHDNPGATHRRKRVGRGPGSGKGKTAGRGMKGQKSRSGVAINGFEGGQMPLYQRLPKRGFTKPNRKRYATVNLGKLESFIARDKINPKAIITEEILVQSGIVNRRHDGIRILAGGELSTKLSIEVTGASKAAIANVEKAGGSLTLIARGKSLTAVEQQL